MVLGFRKSRIHAGIVEGCLGAVPLFAVRVVYENRAVAPVVFVVAVNIGFQPPEIGKHLVEAPLIVAHVRPGLEVIGDAPVKR